MYSPTRLSIDLLARMQIGIRNTDSSISSSAMPSIPSFQAKPENSGSSSWNCHCAPPTSNLAQSSSPSAKSISVAASAMVRASLASAIRQPSPASSGTASITERMGKWFTLSSPRRRPGPSPEQNVDA